MSVTVAGQVWDASLTSYDQTAHPIWTGAVVFGRTGGDRSWHQLGVVRKLIQPGGAWEVFVYGARVMIRVADEQAGIAEVLRNAGALTVAPTGVQYMTTPGFGPMRPRRG